MGEEASEGRAPGNQNPLILACLHVAQKRRAARWAALSSRLVAAPAHVSRNDLSLRERLGCFSLRSALASIWRLRSRVPETCWPHSPVVWAGERTSVG